MNRRVLIILGVALVLLVGMAGALYAFGTPTGPAPVRDVAQSGGAAGSAKGDEGGAAPTGEVPAPDPKSPLAIQIPGCVCHSSDPKLVEEHATYRMNQCAGCHAGRVPTGK